MIWQVIEEQRLSVADLLDDLSDDEWLQPSLCAGWTVRDVAAHLTLQQVGLFGMFSMITGWRGNLDRTIQHVACRRAAAWPVSRIVGEIRSTAGLRRHNLGATHLETLTDLLVHGQDIALPLGRSHPMPPSAAALAADRVLSMRWPPPLPSARKVSGFRLVATDISWSSGAGPEVLGPMGALLLVCCGRLAALPSLSGEGARELGSALAVE